MNNLLYFLLVISAYFLAGPMFALVIGLVGWGMLDD